MRQQLHTERKDKPMSAKKKPYEVAWNRSIGEVIRTTRKEMLISLHTMSTKCGMAKSHLHNVESGNTNVRIYTIHKLSMEMPKLWDRIGKMVGRKRK